MKTIIYQMLPRYWGDYESQNVRNGSLEENGCGHFDDIDDAFLDYLVGKMHCTHLWATGIIRHASSCNTAGCTPSHKQFVKGEAGSPYAITDYYDVNPYLATDPQRRMEEFETMVKRCHRKGLKIILDFVPNHVSRDNVNFGSDDDSSVHWKAENDFFYYPGEELVLPTSFSADENFKRPYREYPAKASGNNCFSSHPGINDWYETVKLNYCDFHTGTWDKMLSIIRFWASKGVDGFRCDMVELVPPEFFSWLISSVRKEYPDLLFVAEVYKRELYHKYLRETGFDLLYDKSGLYDALRDIISRNSSADGGRVELWQSTRRITANWQYLGDLQDNMLNFLENHDEQRIASSYAAGTAGNSFAALAVSLLFNRAPYMIYMGGEIGERAEGSEGFSGNDGRNSIFDWWKVASYGRLHKFVHGGKGLEPSEEKTILKYIKITELAQRNAFANGEVYDLCYCNMGSDGFDPDRHFAFLRYDADETYLVFCNFASSAASARLNIPVMSPGEIEISAGAHDYTVVRLK